MLLQFFRSEFLDVFGDARLEAHHRHESSIGSGDHLKEKIGNESGQAKAAVLLSDTETDQARLTNSFIRGHDVGRRYNLSVHELGFLGPTGAGRFFDFRANLRNQALLSLIFGTRVLDH